MHMDPLSNEQLQEKVPSAFAGQPHHSVSDRYTFIPTVDVIDGMRAAGFFPVQATQSRTKLPEKQVFAKHSIRFRAEDSRLLNVGDSILETVLTNAHIVGTAYDLGLGVYRLTCKNGMMVSEGLVESVHIRHRGDIIKQVVDASINLINEGPKVNKAITKWREINLDAEEQLNLAKDAHTLRFANNPQLAEAFKPEQLLNARRYDDKGSDLWSTFNRIQENVVKGGLRAFANGRKLRSREVKSIDHNTDLNRDLWSLAENLASSKG